MACALALLTALLLGGSGGADATSVTSSGPLPGASESSASVWAVVPMGQLSNPANTFWQLLRGRPGSSHWAVVTPPGVADNGGLVVNATGSSALVGFLPNDRLHFSPLSASADGGTTWNPVYLPGALPPRPDALAQGPGQSGALAIVGANVVRAPPSLSPWSRLVSLATLHSAGGASSCEPGALDAVSFSPAGVPLVATSCRRNGAVGLFAGTDGKWHDEGAALGGRLGRSATEVIALSSNGSLSAALVVAHNAGRNALVAMWQSTGGGWHASRPLGLRPGEAVRSTATSVAGGLTVLVGSSGTTAIDQIEPNDPRWVALPTPPSGTVAVASTMPVTPVFAAVATDAFVVHGGKLDVFALTPGGTKWVDVQTSQVQLAYGSSG